MSAITSSYAPQTVSQAVQHSSKVSILDLKVVVPSALLCLELATIAIVHLWAFPWQAYDYRRAEKFCHEIFPDAKTAYQGGSPGTRGLMDAGNLFDLVKAIGRACHWLLVSRKTRFQDISYHPNRFTGSEPTSDQYTSPNDQDHAEIYDDSQAYIDPDHSQALWHDKGAGYVFAHVQIFPQTRPYSYAQPVAYLPRRSASAYAATSPMERLD